MMNTRFLATFLALFISTITFSQINLGIRGGINFTTVHPTEALDAITPDFRQIATANIGLVSEFELHNNFAIQPEFAYNVKGFKIKEAMDVDLFNIPIPLGVEAISRFSYLEMPVLLKGKVGNDKVKAYAIAGPAVSFAVDGQLETFGKAFFEFQILDTDIDLDAVGYEKWEISGIIGGGVEFAIPSGKIFMDARYQHGFTELYDIPVFNEQIRNRGASISAGYVMSF